ncbi:MAG: hypothetical protein KUG73_08425 [Pseudomonadales bacterium]|nr:hypothetical protein [Pseudomonadales bacterium]
MMEQIVTLFEDFRENNLSYDDLYSALFSKIQQDPSFRHQAIPTLDRVQQQTPIPITHFIQLRSELDSAVEGFVPTETEQTLNTPADPDATLITALPGKLSQPNSNKPGVPYDDSEDATAPNLSVTTQSIVSNSAGASDPTLMAKPVDTIEENADEATMIMPSGTLSGSLPSSMPTNASTVNSEDETVVNHETSPTATNKTAIAETLVGQVYEQPDSEAQAETLVGTQSGAATSSPNKEPLQSTQRLTEKPSIPAAWIWSGGAAFILICSILIVFTSGTLETANNTEVALPKQTKPANNQSDDSWGAAPGILQPTLETKPALPLGVTDDLEISDDIAAATTSPPAVTLSPKNEVTESTDSPSNNPQVNIVAEKAAPVTVAPVIAEKVFTSKEDETSYFVGQIGNAINARNLAPADKLGTATYYLIKLIKASPNSPYISQARSKIAKAHLALAATAREGERWDEAQQHLDDAFTVRLPDSYQLN